MSAADPSLPAGNAPPETVELTEPLGRLAGEICHRVRNDLQNVASLLGLAAAQAPTPFALAEMMEGRIGALSAAYALVLEKRQGPGLDGLVDEILRRLLWRQDGGLALEKQVEALPLSLRLCSPLSLWLYEIILNALRHGQPRHAGGVLVIKGRRHEGGLRLAVLDNGPGLPPGFDINRQARLGLKLSQAMASKELGGSMELLASPLGGLEAVLTVPATEFAILNRGVWT